MSASPSSAQNVDADISGLKIADLITLVESYLSQQITLLSKISGTVQIISAAIDFSFGKKSKLNSDNDRHSAGEGISSKNDVTKNESSVGDNGLFNAFFEKWKSLNDRLDKFFSFSTESILSKKHAKSADISDKHTSTKMESFKKNSHEGENVYVEEIAKASRFIKTGVSTVVASAGRVQRAALGWLGLSETPKPTSQHLEKKERSAKRNSPSDKKKSPSSTPVPKGTARPTGTAYTQPAISKHDSRGIRNNNPGNLNYAGQKGASLEFSGGRFAKFDNAYDGIRAMGRQILRYYDGKTTGHKRRTIEEIITTWAPPEDHNKTDKYIEHVAAKMGIAPNVVLNIRDPEVLGGLMRTIIRHENTRNPYSDELIQAAASGAISQTINNKTDISIHGAGDPAMVGREVHKRQFHVNSQVAQALRPGVS